MVYMLMMKHLKLLVTEMRNSPLCISRLLPFHHTVRVKIMITLNLDFFFSVIIILVLRWRIMCFTGYDILQNILYTFCLSIYTDTTKKRPLYIYVNLLQTIAII